MCCQVIESRSLVALMADILLNFGTPEVLSFDLDLLFDPLPFSFLSFCLR